MKAWYYDESDPSDQRAPHLSSPLPPSDITPLLTSLGVEASHHPTVDTVNTFASSRNYKNRDEVNISPSTMGAAYDEKLKIFFTEHLHEDEEIRYVLDGSGYFDVRGGLGEGEKWVRVWVEKGDLLVLPPGIWHRFTTDEKDYIKAMRLFKDEPKWTPLNRTKELEENPVRKEYVQNVLKSSA
ncbi:1,2-dihydroxy-3-keto-5-methylthiopentene dioxygenase 2 [Ascodesmis nigricans]|uniref:Acireductone dioxygenase n=1 Tax=Ascodesmis nigricans TaxID=341454 RepID=A0A4S2N217_9PEZI|nr:1,2-dihydroxy-3-keto-5-methylthiopentene dioxygenase 2 [Ascodesmis nigricans]